MERDKFNPYNFESSAEKSDDKKDEKKKKSATGLARLIAHEEASKENEKDIEKQPEKDDRSFLQKLAGEAKSEEDVEKVETKDDDSAETQQEAPLETLSAEEEVAIAETYVEQRSQQLASEVDPDQQTPDEVAEARADQAFLAAVQQHLAEKGDEGSVDEAIEAAFQDTANEFDEDEPPEDANEPTEQVETSELSDEVPAGPQEFDPDHAVALGGSGGAAPPSTPPRPPVSPAGAGATPPSRSSISSFRGGVGGTPNVIPGRYDDADVQRFERGAMARGLLVGGVIGYLIGRRRGRIKTEKRLKTVQNKLEKQVADVQQKIEQKEIVIRKMAREKMEQGKEVFAAAAVMQSAERTSASTNEREVSSKASAPERNVSQAAGASRQEMSPLGSETGKNPVDALSKEELLAFSAQIKVGETNLRRVYEAKMVDEAGLRRLIKEYQAGHDLRRALAREFMVKELKFERDPTLRALLPPEAQPKQSSPESRASNGSSVAVAAGAAMATNDSTVSQTALADNSSYSGDSQQNGTSSHNRSGRSHRQTTVSPTVLVGLTLATIVLAVYALWLTITR